MGDGHIHYTHLFTYLGSMLCSTLSDRPELTRRIGLATSAFNRLAGPVLTASDVPLRVKALVYEALILAILLFGCESLAFDADMRRRVCNFHNRCVRRMCRVTCWLQWRHRIPDEVLLQRLGLHPALEYIRRRKLLWFGIVAYMEPTRQPRQVRWWMRMCVWGDPRTACRRDDLAKHLFSGWASLGPLLFKRNIWGQEPLPPHNILLFPKECYGVKGANTLFL